MEPLLTIKGEKIHAQKQPVHLVRLYINGHLFGEEERRGFCTFIYYVSQKYKVDSHLRDITKVDL